MALLQTCALPHGFAGVPVLSRGKIQLAWGATAQQSADLWLSWWFFGTFGTTEPWQCDLQAHSSLLSPSLYVLLFFLSLSVATETVGFVWPLQLLRVINGLRMLIPLYICRLRNSVVLGFLWREYPVTAWRRLLGSSWVHRSLNS